MLVADHWAPTCPVGVKDPPVPGGGTILTWQTAPSVALVGQNGGRFTLCK